MMRLRLTLAALLVGCALHSEGLRAAMNDHVPNEMQACSADSDCVPEPATCHKVACISRNATNGYRSAAIDPHDCTEVLLAEDLVPTDDCACVDSLCVNPKYD